MLETNSALSKWLTGTSIANSAGQALSSPTGSKSVFTVAKAETK